MIDEEKAFEVAKENTLSRLRNIIDLMNNLDFENFIDEYLPHETDTNFDEKLVELVNMSDENKIKSFVEYLRSSMLDSESLFWKSQHTYYVDEIKKQVGILKTRRKKNQIRSTVRRLLKSEKIITWNMLGISLMNGKYNYVSYEAKIVFEYLQELGIEYKMYIDYNSGHPYHQYSDGFYNDIHGRRKGKLIKISQMNKN